MLQLTIMRDFAYLSDLAFKVNRTLNPTFMLKSNINVHSLRVFQ